MRIERAARATSGTVIVSGASLTPCSSAGSGPKNMRRSGQNVYATVRMVAASPSIATTRYHPSGPLPSPFRRPQQRDPFSLEAAGGGHGGKYQSSR